MRFSRRRRPSSQVLSVTRADGRPSAEEILDRVRREAGARRAWPPSSIPGYCAGRRQNVHRTRGVDSTQATRHRRGTDAVIGFIETHNRPKTIELARCLEQVPCKNITYKGVAVEEMDSEAVIERHPAVALVDELAHTDAPGSRHDKRWQDVEVLLSAPSSAPSTSSTWTRGPRTRSTQWCRWDSHLERQLSRQMAHRSVFAYQSAAVQFTRGSVA